MPETHFSLHGLAVDPILVNRVLPLAVTLPFAAKGEVGLFKKGDELVVEIGTLRRHIGLPTSMAGLSPRPREVGK